MSREQYLQETFTTLVCEMNHPGMTKHEMSNLWLMACDMADKLEEKGVASWLIRHVDTKISK